MREKKKKILMSLSSKQIELQDDLEKLNAMIKEVSIEFKRAAAEGDHSENAAYTSSKEKLMTLSNDKMNVLISLKDINQLNIGGDYVQQETIGPYATFELTMKGTTSVWCAFPGNVSDIDRGIMSCHCSIYKKLEGRRTGDVLKVKNELTGVEVEIIIGEIY